MGKKIYANEQECFDAKVEKSSPAGCWTWRGAVALYGRGIFSYGKKTMQAHRAAWRLANGDIPEGMCILHRCDNPLCVNPAHLFMGTQIDNLADMKAKGRENRSGRKWIPEETRQAIRSEFEYADAKGIQDIAKKYDLTVKSVLRICGKWHPKAVKVE